MKKVERIRLAPVNGPRRTLYLEINKNTKLWLTGKELNKEGVWDGVFHVIDKSAIVKRTPVEMNLQYGIFEETKVKENPMNCTGCGKAISGAYEAGSYSCSGCGAGVKVNPLSNPLSGRQRKDVERALDNHDHLKPSYFWTPAGNASGRRHDEKKYSFGVRVVYKGDEYTYDSNVRVSVKNFYYTGTFRKNGKKGDVRIFKKLLTVK